MSNRTNYLDITEQAITMLIYKSLTARVYYLIVLCIYLLYFAVNFMLKVLKCFRLYICRFNCRYLKHGSHCWTGNCDCTPRSIEEVL